MRHLHFILFMSLIVVGVEATNPAVCPASGPEQSAQRQVVISIKGMMCSSCGREIEKILKKVAGVSAVNVDVPNDRATVFYDVRKITPQQLAAAIRNAGYEALLP